MRFKPAVGRLGLFVLLLAALLAACRGAGPLAAPMSTAEVLAATARAAGGEAATALASGATGLAPTAEALATQAANAAATAGTALANVTPPQPVDADEAEAVITQYAQEVLGLSVVIVRAGGLNLDIQRQIALPEGAGVEEATAAAAQTYGALLNGGAGSVSYGRGRLTGDITFDIHSASVGVFTFDAPNPRGEAAALVLALETFPALAGRDYVRYPTTSGYAWFSVGEVEGFDLSTGGAALVAEEVVLAVVPTVPTRVAVTAVVGKGDLAAGLAP